MTVLLAMGFVAAGATSLVLVAVARRLFARWGFVDHPGGRKIHAVAVPYGGGAAVFLTFLLALGAGLLVVAFRDSTLVSRLPAADLIHRHAEGVMSRAGALGGLLAAAALLFVVGLIDDRRRLSAWPKLLAQLLAAAVVPDST